LVDWDLLRESNGGVGAGEALGASSLILFMLEVFPVAFLAFFWGVGFADAFHLHARVFDGPALAPADGSLADLPHGDWAKTGIVGKGMCPSNPGMGEVKLSKACIQTYKYKITRR
jgi:hypothetical protein